ncbi:hypothetical protein D6833_05140 [Candidatus Parcubacteria bacterium]|nr:MAG: hypothetical protein D6833_05140 [Candidatus Parcubacteria bacterium]
MLQIAEHTALQEHIPTAVFSLEMPGERLMNRIISQLSGIPLTNLRNNGLTQQEWALLAETAGLVAESPLYINDAPGLTATQVRSQCMRLASSSGGLGLVVIDYLQLMSGGGKYRSRVDEVTEISRSMKALAREIGAPVLAAAQLSRAVEQRQDKRPSLSDLRESGSIEQDADIVMFVYPRGDIKSQKFISVDKHRDGPTGTIEATFHGSTVSFS